MKKKIEIALELLNVIQDLELSFEEMEEFNTALIKAFPTIALQNMTDSSQILQQLQLLSNETSAMKELLSQRTLMPQPEPNKEENPCRQNSSETPLEAPASKPSSTTKKSQRSQGPKHAPTPKSQSNKNQDAPTQISTPPKGFSKNGKKLGRPLKASHQDNQPLTTQKKTEEHPQSEPSEEDKLAQNDKASAIEQSTALPEPFPDIDEIERLKYGKEYSLEAVYEFKNVFIRTKRLMSGTAHPIGVIVPYTHQNREGQILIRYEDEHAVISLKQASQYARHKLTPFYDHHWRIKEDSDDAHICAGGYLATVNEMFKKMGGDELKGCYFNGKNNYFGDKFDQNRKIRYVCDIYLPNDEE